MSHIEFGTHVATQNSNADDDSQLHAIRQVPIWTWSSLQLSQLFFAWFGLVVPSSVADTVRTTAYPSER